VYVFGHDDVSENQEGIAPSDCFPRLFKEVSRARRTEVCLPPVTAEGKEMKVARLLISAELVCH
jgi:hypothetical protein